MSTIRLMGSQKAYVRAYRLASGETVNHLRSAARFSTLNNISSAIQSRNEPGFDGQKTVLFIERQHLPFELTAALSGSLAFHRFCEVIGFAAQVQELKLSQDRLPRSVADHAMSSARHSPGFPITKPVMVVNPNDSLSFNELELRGFLGQMAVFAGKIMIVNINDSNGQQLPAQDMNPLIQRFLATLQRS